eukprot:scaffold136_cov325-Pavlova_lutheri.AAC.11
MALSWSWGWTGLCRGLSTSKGNDCAILMQINGSSHHKVCPLPRAMWNNSFPEVRDAWAKSPANIRGWARIRSPGSPVGSSSALYQRSQ